MTAEPECHETFWDNGQMRYRSFSVNGKLHKTDGPAREWWNQKGRLVGCAFFVNGARHNADGPADEWYNVGRVTYRAFYVNGKAMSAEDFRTWQERHQRQRELAALVFALEHKFPAEVPEREFLRHILPAHVAGEAAT